MPASFKVELQEAIELRRAMDQTVKDLSGGPMLEAMKKSTLLVVGTARKEAKSDRGVYRNSITPAVSQNGKRVEGIVGSNLAYAPFAMLDTKPHWPPIAPILAWVRRKRLAKGSGKKRSQEERGIAFMIARRISRKGTKGDHALEKGIDQNVNGIVRLLTRAVEKIVGG